MPKELIYRVSINMRNVIIIPFTLLITLHTLQTARLTCRGCVARAGLNPKP